MEFPLRSIRKHKHQILIGLGGLVTMTVITRPSALLTFALIVLAGNLTCGHQHSLTVHALKESEEGSGPQCRNQNVNRW